MSLTIGALYKEGAALLAAAGVREAEHDARELLAHVLGCRPNDILLRAGEAADPLTERLADHLFSLRARRMPLRYVTRTAHFGGLEFRSDDRALVPRQETELLLDAVLERLPALRLSPEALLADVGCGTGAIGLTLATRTPGLNVVLTDLSPAAAELARENAVRLGLQDRARVLVGSYLEPLLEAGLQDRLAVIVCNPPYVRPNEISMLEPEVLAEPRVAVESPEADGMTGYRVIAAGLGAFPNVRLLAFEVGFAQEEDVADMFRPLGRVEILPDLAGIERVVIAHVG